ncbi:MAG: molybdopterin cofactor-binding domain-containing protein [Sporichthyaceae bacterium]
MALVRSPHPHAVLFGIDEGSIADLDGVRQVLTALDLPGAFTYGQVRADRPVLASGVVRHVGEPVAAVLAVDGSSALRGAERLQVSYRPLPPAPNPTTMSDPIHPDGSVVAAVHLRRGKTFPPMVLPFDAGRPGSPMPGAAVVVEGQYALDSPIAPTQTSVSACPCEGGVEITVAGALSVDLRDQLAQCLNLDGPAVVLRAASGRGEGGGELSAAVMCALFALRTGQSVRLVEDPIEGGLSRRWVWLAYRHHADAQGRLLGVQAEIRLDAGAYAGDCAALVAALCAAGVGPYHVENVDLDVVAVRTTNPPLPTPAGGGSEAVAFAVEAQLDRLARGLGRDGLQLRAVNALDLDHPLPTGQFLATTRPSLMLLDRLATPPPGVAPDPGENGRRGIGFAAAVVPRAPARGAGRDRGPVPTLRAGNATSASVEQTRGEIRRVEGLDGHGQGHAHAGFAVVASRVVLDAADSSVVHLHQVRIAVQAPGPVAESAASAIKEGARTAMSLALPQAGGPDSIEVDLIAGAQAGADLANAAEIGVGAVIAAVRAAMDQATGGDAEVVPIPGVRWARRGKP